MAYESTWNSLSKHSTPQWLMDAKFGIYYHWGPYSVPACGPNGSWYPHNMYKKGTPQYRYHVKNYGKPSEFGYKDFIPDLTAEFFDADAWVDLFKKAGAQFAGPVAVHHDNFAMWDSKVNEWNAAKMGPKRDLVGEMERAIRKTDMKFLVAFHHAENWWFFPHWLKDCDTSDPKYSGLYGPLHNTESPQWDDSKQDFPNKMFLDLWRDQIIEVIDNYKPDIMWFDYGLNRINDKYKRDVFTYYFNKAIEWDKEVDIMYKEHHIPPNIGMLDYERGRHTDLTHFNWISDTSIDDQGAWGYVEDAKYKSSRVLIHNLVDRVAKNGLLLLNFGPKANGEVPEGARNSLLSIGNWLKTNGDSLYNTNPWHIAEEGPTKLRKSGGFNEKHEVSYTELDIRFTIKDENIYAIVLGRPDNKLHIRSLIYNRAKLSRMSASRFLKSLGRTRRFLKRYDMRVCLRNLIHYNVYISENKWARHFYSIKKSQIDGIELLGYDGEIKYDMSDKGLFINFPRNASDQHAYVFKIRTDFTDLS